MVPFFIKLTIWVMGGGRRYVKIRYTNTEDCVNLEHRDMEGGRVENREAGAGGLPKAGSDNKGLKALLS